MSLQIFFLSMFLLFGKTSAPQHRNVNQIEFDTSTRGYHKTISITQQSLKIAEQSSGDVHERMIEKKIDLATWDRLMRCIENISLTEIPSLTSPTMKRAADAARMSTLTITNDKGETYAHTFDDENPNKKLHSLMLLIQDLSKPIGESTDKTK